MTGEEGLERQGMFSSCCGCRQMAPGVCASGFAHPTHRTRMGPGKRAGDTELTGNDLPPAQLRAYCSLFWAALSGSFLQERSLEVVPPSPTYTCYSQVIAALAPVAPAIIRCYFVSSRLLQGAMPALSEKTGAKRGGECFW